MAAKSVQSRQQSFFDKQVRLPSPGPHMPLTPDAESRIIEMAWEDRTPFEAIATQFGLRESDVIVLMRRKLKPGSFRRWRQRVSGRHTKHASRRDL